MCQSFPADASCCQNKCILLLIICWYFEIILTHKKIFVSQTRKIMSSNVLLLEENKFKLLTVVKIDALSAVSSWFLLY